MGLRHHGLDGPTFQMREKIFAIGDDFWIEDADGNRVFKVDGKAVRLRDTFILEDAHGNGVTIQEKKLSVRDKMTIESGSTKATVHKRLIGIRGPLRHRGRGRRGPEGPRQHRRSRVRDRARWREDRGGLQEVVPRSGHLRDPAGPGAGCAADPRHLGLRRPDVSRLGGRRGRFGPVRRRTTLDPCGDAQPAGQHGAEPGRQRSGQGK